MQETFYSAFKGIHKFKGDSKISKWLYEIAKNKWKDYLRKNNKRKSISLDENGIIENLIFEDDFIEQLNFKSERIALCTSIHKLDENTREVFYLRINGNL